METLCDLYVDMAKYLQKNLLLDVAWLGHSKCLDSGNIKKKCSLIRIGRLAEFLPHQVSTRGV